MKKLQFSPHYLACQLQQEADRRLPEEMFVAVNPAGVCFANSKTKVTKINPPHQVLKLHV